MSFPHRTAYLVRPTDALRARSRELPDDDGVLLTENEIFLRADGSYKGTTPDGWTDEFKLIYLVVLHDTYLLDLPDEDAAAFHHMVRELLGPPPWTTETFDRWWLVERHVVDDIADDLAQTPSLSKLGGPPELLRRLTHAAAHPTRLTISRPFDFESG
ncbi:MAG: hypothetical protein AB1Z98_07915 [Nannocystaceae bacterium]